MVWSVKEVMTWVDPRTAKIFLTPLPHVIHLRRPCSTVPNHISLVALLKYEISVLEQQRDELRANVNMGAIAEYQKKEKLKLKEMYQMITLGGDTELELVDSLDVGHRRGSV